MASCVRRKELNNACRARLDLRPGLAEAPTFEETFYKLASLPPALGKRKVANTITACSIQSTKNASDHAFSAK